MSQANIAHYQLQSRLGKGAMGVVFRARDERLERDVAIKLLQVNLESDEAAQYAARLLQEARSAARLNHPGIITVYDCGEWRGKPYLAMELVQGITLKDWLEKRGALSIRQVISIARQMFAALGHAHRHKVIHRDIKPANLMLTKEGRLKITDFGIAQLPASDLTRTGTVLGSPRYMSPEQLAGKKLDGRADLYSAGVVLYQCLTGKAPFDGETTMNIVYQVLHTTPPAPHELRPEVPRALSDLVMRCIEKQADRRFNHLDAALAALLGGESPAPRSEAAADEATQAFNTTADLATPPSAAKSPLVPWLTQTGSLLSWLALHGLRLVRWLAQEIWRATRIGAQLLQRWAPVYAAKINRTVNRIRPHVKQALLSTWRIFRAWPHKVQIAVSGFIFAGVIWALWPSQPVAEIEFSQDQAPQASVVNTLEDEHQQRNQLLQQLAAQQDQAEAHHEAVVPDLPKVKLKPSADEPINAAKSENAGSLTGQLHAAGQALRRDAKGLFDCITGERACPKSQPSSQNHSERRP